MTTNTYPQALQDVRAIAALTSSHSARRTILTRSTVFARLTVGRPVEYAERSFAGWMADGADIRNVPTGRFPTRDRRFARSVSQWPSALIEAVWADAARADGTAERALAAVTAELGPAKASFALACAGIGRIGCIDSRLEAKHAERLRPYANQRATGRFDWTATGPGWIRYVEACRALWPAWPDDTARGQWAEWLHDRAREGRTVDHRILERIAP
jgi:hypothetical protein